MDFEIDDLVNVVRRLVKDMPGVLQRAYDGQDSNLKTLLEGNGGWHIPDVLRTAAACALAKRLPSDHPDVLFIVNALAKYGYSEQ